MQIKLLDLQEIKSGHLLVTYQAWPASYLVLRRIQEKHKDT